MKIVVWISCRFVKNYSNNLHNFLLYYEVPSEFQLILSVVCMVAMIYHGVLFDTRILRFEHREVFRANTPSYDA